jgi:hypothetical protein
MGISSISDRFGKRGIAGKRVRLLSARGRGRGLGNDIALVGWRVLTRPTGGLGLENSGGWR